MRNALTLLSSLILAAAASAQTASLAPVARSGFSRSPRATGWSPVKTFRAGMSGTSREGWAAEYDLSALPLGARVVSARLASSLSGVSAAGLSLDLRAYAGNGAVGPTDMGAGSLLASLAPPQWTTGRLDVAVALQARLDAGDRYAGFSLAPIASSVAVRGGGAAWSYPSLEIAYTVPHGLARGGWPMVGGSPSNAFAGGPVQASGLLGESLRLASVLAIGADGCVYARVIERGIVATEASGAERWVCPVAGNCGALTADGTVYALGKDLTAIDAVTGKVRWSVDLRTNSGIGQRVEVFDDGTVVAVNELGIVAFDPSGRELWRKGGLPTQGCSARAEDGAFLVKIDGNIDCLDPHTGALLNRIVGSGATGLIVTGGTVAWPRIVAWGAPRHSYTKRTIPLPPEGPPRRPGDSIYWGAPTTAQDFALQLCTAPVHGGTTTVTGPLAIGTSTAVATWQTRNSFPSPAPPSGLYARWFGRAPNGLYALGHGFRMEIVGPSSHLTLNDVVPGPLAISSEGVLYLGTGAYDLATGTRLWSLTLPGSVQGVFIGPEGALWVLLFTDPPGDDHFYQLQRVR